MRNPVKKLSLLITAASLILGCACCSDQGDGEEEPEGFLKKQQVNLSLEVVSPQRWYVAGKENQKVTYRLKNEDLKAVKLTDWKLKEADNIVLSYGEADVDGQVREGGWIQVNPDPKAKQPDRKGRRAQCVLLELNPGNSTLVELPLKFLKDLKAKEGERKRYVLKAELNSKIVEVKSSTTPILVK